MMGTRNLWDKLSSKRNYSSFVGNKVKKYDIDFKIKYINGTHRGPGCTGTLESSMYIQMEEENKFQEELLEAISDEDLGDIWEVIRN